MTKPNWIAHNVTFSYGNAIVTAIVEVKIENGWDIIFCLSSGVNISLLSQLPPGWVFVPFCGGNQGEKFRIFPTKKIITYGDLTEEEGIQSLLQAISVLMKNKECANEQI